MRSILFKRRAEVTCAKAPGSEARIEKGVGWTAGNPGTCNPGWFVGDTTIILGTQPGETVARWQVLVEPLVVERYEEGYLLICCERTQGGLHTARKGALARVSINGHNRDLIGLKDEPAGHTDFFHRLPKPPQLASVWPVSACHTVYSWPVDKRHLAISGNQVVDVKLEEGVSWDIDYVCLVIWSKSYQLRDACKQVGYVLLGAILGAVLGAIATLLFGG